MANCCLLLVRLDDILNFEFLPLDATLCARLPLALIVFLILGCNFSLLLLLPHFELYETVLALILVRVARRRPSEINNEKYCEMLIFSFSIFLSIIYSPPFANSNCLCSAIRIEERPRFGRVVRLQRWWHGWWGWHTLVVARIR